MAKEKTLLEQLAGVGDAEWSSGWREGDLAVVDGEGDHASLASDDLGAPPPKTLMAVWLMIQSRSPPSSFLSGEECCTV